LHYSIACEVHVSSTIITNTYNTIAVDNRSLTLTIFEYRARPKVIGTKPYSLPSPSPLWQ
jgi:hypothetical protein